MRQLVVTAMLALCGYFATAGVAIWGAGTLPSAWIIGGFMLLSLLTLSMAFRVPGPSYLTLDRATQIAMILIFGPLTAAIVAVVVYPIWSVIDDLRTRDVAPEAAIVRALCSAGAIGLTVLAGGGVYYAAGGTAHLSLLNGQAIGALIAMAVTMQVVHVSLMGLLSWARHDRLTAAFSPWAVLLELAMLPFAVLMALVYDVLPVSNFLLLVMVLLLFSLLVHNFLRSRASLEQRVRQMDVIGHLAEAVNAAIPVDELARLVYKFCGQVFDFSSFQLVLYDRSSQEIDFLLEYNKGKRMPRRRISAGDGLLGWIVQNNEPVLVTDWDTDDRAELKQRGIVTGPPPASFMGVPAHFNGRVLGAISIRSAIPNQFAEHDLELMTLFAGQVGAAIANASQFGELEGYRRDLERKVEERTESLREANVAKEQLLEELDRLSKHDGLTGLVNRRYMDERLVEELQRAQRFERNVAVAMADIDHFKNINDTFSHGIGDEVLRTTAQIFRQACRAVDIISRYGGEEFIICFPDTDTESASKVCERIRYMMHSYAWDEIQPGLRVTISIGVVGGTCYEKDALQKQADKKLYEAKGAGRDRVCA